MRIHHLNCTTMCPPGGRLMDGRRGFTGPAALTCHCLLVETARGLVLVDTGFGLNDVYEPRVRLNGLFRDVLCRPALVEESTAIRQVERLGFQASDVRDIILTHLDFDHAGGLDDFPHARVHLLAEEYRVASAQRTWLDRARFRPQQWSLDKRWETYSARRGEGWFGFDCVRELSGLPPEILLVPLTGHTLGHAGVAIDTGEGWLLHAGDAYFHHGEMDLDRYRCTVGLRAYQKLMQKDGWMRWYNLRRLRELVQRHGEQVTVFCAHDSLEFERLEEREKLPLDFPIQPGLVPPVPSLHL
ncbi:MBL fold metallo-hydrolase [Corallococcus sp. BB11-1]|uniref:MBL fold metallo-hydrolase n=1 Tax=Corallococcus sp. BB11-1 TaxID=2996783 RepID=UPI00226DD3A1|nr:MBL fold metallo-hydrolase [Corallococcus sp. BB11-1]MCY1029890.1 MBL fold metallo-hydrolase [Corallococcus sp. BB11-1]